MTTLLIETPDHSLTLQNGSLRCRHPETGSRLIPWNGIEQIVLGRKVTLASDVLLKAAEKGVEIVVAGQRSKQIACLFPLHTPSSDFKIKQYQVLTNITLKARCVRLLLQCRAKGQKRCLRMLGVEPPAQWHGFANDLLTQKNMMLMEAQLTSSYWQALAPSMSEFGFLHRERRPPRDPVNALLSLTSTMADPINAKILMSQGFDIGLGIHHSTGYYRQSLVLDFKELTRAELEHWVCIQFLTKKLTPAHFQQTDDGCRLTHEGQKVFYPNWYGFLKQYKKTVWVWAKKTKRFVLALESGNQGGEHAN